MSSGWIDRPNSTGADEAVCDRIAAMAVAKTLMIYILLRVCMYILLNVFRLELSLVTVGRL